MFIQIREDVLFGSAVSSIVANHQSVNSTLGGKVSGELPIVGRNADSADLALLPESAQLFLNVLSKVLLLGDAEEEEDIDIIGAQLAESLLQSAAETRVTPHKVICPEKVVGSSGDDQLFSPGLENVS